jgi:hypothetical protein
LQLSFLTVQPQGNYFFTIPAHLTPESRKGRRGEGGKGRKGEGEKGRKGEREKGRREKK